MDKTSKLRRLGERRKLAVEAAGYRRQARALSNEYLARFVSAGLEEWGDRIAKGQTDHVIWTENVNLRGDESKDDGFGREVVVIVADVRTSQDVTKGNK